MWIRTNNRRGGTYTLYLSHPPKIRPLPSSTHRAHTIVLSLIPFASSLVSSSDRFLHSSAAGSNDSVYPCESNAAIGISRFGSCKRTRGSRDTHREREKELLHSEDRRRLFYGLLEERENFINTRISPICCRAVWTSMSIGSMVSNLLYFLSFLQILYTHMCQTYRNDES